MSGFAVSTDVIEAIARRAAELVLEGIGKPKGRKRRVRLLGDEIASFLAANPGATTYEVARGVRARDELVRAVLAGDARFERRSHGARRPANAKCWVLISEGMSARPIDADEERRRP